MPKFEYLVMYVAFESFPHTTLDGLGSDGWELVAVNWATGLTVFKRRTA